MARTKFDSSHLVSVTECIDRMKAVAGVKTDTELALAMGRARNTVGNWRLKEREMPPEFVIDFCVKYGVIVDKILFGDRSVAISQSVTGNGNAAAAGENSSANINSPGQIRQSPPCGIELNQMEREFIGGMRRYGRISDWAECFSILEKAKKQ